MGLSNGADSGNEGLAVRSDFGPALLHFNPYLVLVYPPRAHPLSTRNLHVIAVRDIHGLDRHRFLFTQLSVRVIRSWTFLKTDNSTVSLTCSPRFAKHACIAITRTKLPFCGDPSRLGIIVLISREI